MALNTAHSSPLPENAVHVWVTVTEQCRQPALLERYLSILDNQERSRYEGFRFCHHRHDYLVAHGLLRFCLSHYGGRKPDGWTFSHNDYGRPEIWVAEGKPPLRFNLSHTSGLVTCAVTQSADVGVDVECKARRGDLAAIAKLSFTATELLQLHQLTGEAWRDRFFNLWTLKEAYIKGRGLGLSLPLQQLAFEFSPANQIQFELLASERDQEIAESWKFSLMSPTSQHQLAVAVRCSNSLLLQIKQAIPGVMTQPLELPLATSQGVIKPN